MKQAQVLTEAEQKRLLAMIAQGRHAARNRVAVMLSYLAGLRSCLAASTERNGLLSLSHPIRNMLWSA